jgi:hypothetical protein
MVITCCRLHRRAFAQSQGAAQMPPCFISINWHANVSGSAFQQLAGGRNRCTPKMGRTGFWQISEWEEVAEGGARIPGKSAQK